MDENWRQALRAAEERDERGQFARAALAPRPTHLHYPAPWRVAESRGEQVVVVCAEGHEAAAAPSMTAAIAIVMAVNEFAGVA